MKIKLVEYNHSYAAAIAEMWGRSSDGWGGYDFNATEESIKQDVDNSSYLNVYLDLYAIQPELLFLYQD